MKLILNIVLIFVSQCIYAQATSEHIAFVSDRVISLGSYNIVIPGDWLQRTEPTSNQQTVTTIYHPEGTGSLKFMSMITASKEVTQEVLRNMTNVDASISLNWHKWGDFSGYQYDYTENGSNYRQWWLTNPEQILFIVYSNDSQDEDEPERKVINRIVSSITEVNTVD